MSSYADELASEAVGGVAQLKRHWQRLLSGEHGDHGLPLNSFSVGLESSRIVKSGPGILFGFSVLSTNIAAQFILLFDAATLPSNGALPVFPFNIGAAGEKDVSYIFPGRFFQRGIVIANSTTAASLTLGAADCWFDAQYL